MNRYRSMPIDRARALHAKLAPYLSASWTGLSWNPRGVRPTFAQFVRHYRLELY